MATISPVLRWRIKDLLAKRGWTAYKLAQESGLAIPVVYRLSHDPKVSRIEAATLEALCKAFNVQPGDLLAFDGSVSRLRRKP